MKILICSENSDMESYLNMDVTWNDTTARYSWSHNICLNEDSNS